LLNIIQIGIKIQDIRGIFLCWISPKISIDQQNHFHILPEAEEIESIVKEMNGDSSPGPDGFSGAFFPKCWDIVLVDITEAIRHFFLTGLLLKEWNNTNKPLIPKKEGAGKMEDYRPISLCNFTYQIITKILAERMKGILHLILTKNQAGFLKNRTIHDNIHMAQELTNQMHKKRKGGALAAKIDISKAFYRTNWDFILEAMKRMGFPERFRRWIHQCISSPKFRININGALTESFSSSQGLRQGDPISPLLFIIAEEVLSRHILKLQEVRKIQPIYRSQGAQACCHLLFADDILLFFKPTLKAVDSMSSLLGAYQTQAGQPVSSAKSQYFHKHIPARLRQYIQDRLGMQPGHFPTKYLGLPLFKGASRKSLFQELQAIRNERAGNPKQ